MKNPAIEQIINSINNKHITVSSFATLGSTALTLINPLFSILTVASSIPLLFSLKTRYELKKSHVYSDPLFANTTYKKKFTKWFENYLNSSNNIDEKKFKLAFISVWLNSKKINLNSLVSPFNEQINVISYELMNKNIIDENLHSIFSNTIFSMTAYDVLKEDLKHNIASVKKIYEEYKDCGLLGKSFKKGFDKNFYLLALLQDYQLTQTDINEIINNKEINSYIVDPAALYTCDFQDVQANFHPTKGHYIISKIVENNNDKATLQSLKEFYLKPSTNHEFHTERLDILNDFIKIIDKKLHYLELEEKIQHKISDNNSANSTKKNKI